MSMLQPLCAGLLGAVLLHSAQAEVLDSGPDGFTVSNTAVVDVRPEKAWRALVNDVDAWWPRDHTWWGKDSKLHVDARAGGCFCERSGKRSAQHMTVTHVDPPGLMRWTGGLGPLQGMGAHGALEWRIAADGDGARITMYYRVGGYGPEDMASFAAVVDRVQAQQLDGLAKHLGGARSAE